MISAEVIGRNLHISVEGIADPYVIRPLPGRAGLQATETYLNSVGGGSTPADLAQMLMITVDGAVFDGDRWVPVPVEDQTNYTRIGNELSQTEAELVLMPAFFWQTILGYDGVKAYIEGGADLHGTLKATAALSSRLGRLTRTMLPPSESATPTRTASTPTTSSRPAGKKPGKRKHPHQKR